MKNALKATDKDGRIGVLVSNTRQWSTMARSKQVAVKMVHDPRLIELVLVGDSQSIMEYIEIEYSHLIDINHVGILRVIWVEKGKRVTVIPRYYGGEYIDEHKIYSFKV